MMLRFPYEIPQNALIFSQLCLALKTYQMWEFGRQKIDKWFGQQFQLFAAYVHST